MGSRQISKRVLASPGGIVMVVWLLGHIFDDGLYPGKSRVVARAASNGGYFAGAKVPNEVVVPDPDAMAGRGYGLFVIVSIYNGYIKVLNGINLYRKPSYPLPALVFGIN
ncbi:hypothetical protein AVEN_119051-1 [Araneus ventricosus]|uniref:Uncharacterized protein n=1 Tax=Araneus ventricosus TaxID=182803 RepID=A0A4Y1ZRH9_ARAVE|nr:hypothetical protein AVEN_10254-1 [Araneus ventricosus]GBL63356.1 hypothetical protein AVEN_119051-1 [Araneus ventricosus]